MAAPTGISSSAYLYFSGSFDVASGTATLFISGTGNMASGAMPLFLKAKDTSSAQIPLYLSAFAKTSAWQSLSSQWDSYNISCNTGATNFCQDWEYIPYYAGQASGQQSSSTLFIKGAYRVSTSGAMPLFLLNDGSGLSEGSSTLFMYAENNETQSTGLTTLFMSGRSDISAYITLATSGAYPAQSGEMTIFCQAYDSSETTVKLFISGI